MSEKPYDMQNLVERLMTGQAARDMAVLAVTRDHAWAAAVSRHMGETLPEAERLKVLLAVMAEENRRLMDAMVKMDGVTPRVYVMPAAPTEG